MYLRIFSHRGDDGRGTEVLIRADSIWKIEVSYTERAGSMFWKTSLKDGMDNPESVRLYRIYVGDNYYTLAANPGSRVIQALEDIYKNAIKDD